MENKKIYLLKKQAFLCGSLFFVCVLFSCQNKNILAKVDGIELTSEDVDAYLKLSDKNPKDKKERKKFVKDWVNYQAVLEELKINNPEKYTWLRTRSMFDLGEIALYHLQLEKVKNTNELVISDSVIKKYYNEHAKDFELKDFIVKALYVKIPINQAEAEMKLKDNFKLPNPKSLSIVEATAKLYASNYYYNDVDWAYFQNIFKDAPMEQFNRQSFVINRTKTFFKDSEYVYFINIFDYKLKSDNPPYDFLKDRIRQTILAKKINDLKSQNQAKLVNDILKKHEVEIYNN